MMKKSIFLLLYIFIFASCAVSKHIIQDNNSRKELKSFQLIQNPSAYLSDDRGIIGGPDFKVHSTYIFEPKENAHPLISVTFKDLSPKFNSLDAELFIDFDGETIKVPSKYPMTEAMFAIPENLWVSFVYSQQINCRIQSSNGRIEIAFNESEKSKLTQFFQRAIEQRDIQFPAIPEGKKKW